MTGWLHEFERRGLIRLEENTQNWEVATSLPAGPQASTRQIGDCCSFADQLPEAPGALGHDGAFAP
jgi:hypothetical protein